jgi:hypothetical protein
LRASFGVRQREAERIARPGFLDQPEDTRGNRRGQEPAVIRRYFTLAPRIEGVAANIDTLDLQGPIEQCYRNGICEGTPLTSSLGFS